MGRKKVRKNLSPYFLKQITAYAPVLQVKVWIFHNISVTGRLLKNIGASELPKLENGENISFQKYLFSPCLCVRLCMCACLCMCEWMRVCLCIFWHENPISPGILRFMFMIASEVKGAWWLQEDPERHPCFQEDWARHGQGEHQARSRQGCKGVCDNLTQGFYSK